jgi:quercetin dioxygenase-like cupin family protein
MRRTVLWCATVCSVAALGGSTASWLPIASAQQTPAAPTVTRTVLRERDLPGTTQIIAMVSVELPPGAREGRHTHSGTLVAFVREGEMTLEHQGKAAVYKAGETFTVDPGQVHEGMNKGSVPTRLVATFIYEKGKPMTTLVP